MIISHGAQLLLTTTTRMTRYFISVPSMLMRPLFLCPNIFSHRFSSSSSSIFLTPFYSSSSSSPSSSSPHLIVITLSSLSPCLPLHPVFFLSTSSSPRLLHRIFFLTHLLPHPVFTASSSSPCLPPVRGSEHLDLLTFLRFSDPNILAHGIKVFFISPSRCNLKNIRAVQGGTVQIMNGPRTLE